MTAERGYIEPFKMFDNLYYVGDKWVSSYLITSDNGLLLIDTLEFPYSKWIPINIRKLGFNPDALKYILITHAHSDHVAGAGYLQEHYQAKVLMTEEDTELLDKQAIKNSFTKPVVNQHPNDGDSLEFGNTEITFYKTPGHTNGCMSMELTVYDNGKPERAFIVCGNGTNFEGLTQSREYLESVIKIGKISSKSPQVTVNMPSHPHLGQLFSRRDNMNKKAKVNPFIDRDSFVKFIHLLEKRGQRR
jgi:metallo-beta-lactamase class B